MKGSICLSCSPRQWRLWRCMTTSTLLTVMALVLPITAPAADGTSNPRVRAGITRSALPLVIDVKMIPRTALERRQAVVTRPADSIWNGIAIGAAVGAGGGYLWGRNLCPGDKECLYRSVPVGILAGAGIGAAIGGILDALQR